MDPVRLTSREEKTEIHLGQTLDIRRVRAAHRLLHDALTRKRPIVVDAAELERIDGAGLQLLVAFRLAASARAIPLEWSARHKAFEQSAARLGVSEALGWKL